jgi:hypothetical protein
MYFRSIVCGASWRTASPGGLVDERDRFRPRGSFSSAPRRAQDAEKADLFERARSVRVLEGFAQTTLFLNSSACHWRWWIILDAVAPDAFAA